ncbi:hypothetical protein Pcinc_005814 [Petrolisthes cinctipes]|uniref:Uncharacterized protein n=1 Tax=Petrolisthes cinctipes TaxID=88211 RepID=A0AAE1GEA5_PETCI|nr:hypothetical protein Pcinc_005814 [Petrolisthes cinctipes]
MTQSPSYIRQELQQKTGGDTSDTKTFTHIEEAMAQVIKEVQVSVTLSHLTLRISHLTFRAAIISAMDLHEVFDFKENGFDNVIEKVTEDSVTIRTNIRTRDDFKKWNEVYMAKTHSRFNSKRLRSVGERKLFRKVLICHHGVKHKGVKKTCTG